MHAICKVLLPKFETLVLIHTNKYGHAICCVMPQCFLPVAEVMHYPLDLVALSHLNKSSSVKSSVKSSGEKGRPPTGNQFENLGSQVNTSFELAVNLCFVWPPTCVDLHGLALTLVELKFVCKSTQVFHCLATQRKSTQVAGKSFVYMHNIDGLCELESRLAKPFSARLCKSVGKYWFCKLSLTCVDLQVHLTQALVTLVTHWPQNQTLSIIT